MAIIWPRSNSFEFDANGTRAPGAKLYFYDAGTSTPKPAYQDAALGTAYTQPVTADGNGRWPSVFLDYGAYKERATTSGGTTLWTVDDIPNDAPTDPAAGVDADSIFQTGDTIITFKNSTRTGFVRCNGRTIGSAASAATERANADCADLFAFIWNNFANGQAAVSTGRGASASADFAANKTIALPDGRGAGLIGFDDMGNSAASLLGSAPVVSGSGILAGSILGANTHTITVDQIAAHTHGVSLTSGGESAVHTHAIALSTSSDGAHTHTGTADSDGAHTHNYDKPQTNTIFAAGGAAGSTSSFTSTATSSNGAHTHTFTTASNGAHTHSVSGTSGNQSAAHTHDVSGLTSITGTSTAHNIISRSIPVTVLMKL